MLSSKSAEELNAIKKLTNSIKKRITVHDLTTHMNDGTPVVYSVGKKGEERIIGAIAEMISRAPLSLLRIIDAKETAFHIGLGPTVSSDKYQSFPRDLYTHVSLDASGLAVPSKGNIYIAASSAGERMESAGNSFTRDSIIKFIKGFFLADHDVSCAQIFDNAYGSYIAGTLVHEMWHIANLTAKENPPPDSTEISHAFYNQFVQIPRNVIDSDFRHITEIRKKHASDTLGRHSFLTPQLTDFFADLYAYTKDFSYDAAKEEFMAQFFGLVVTHGESSAEYFCPETCHYYKHVIEPALLVILDATINNKSYEEIKGRIGLLEAQMPERKPDINWVQIEAHEKSNRAGNDLSSQLFPGQP